MVLALVAAAVLTFYFYGKAKELQIAEQRAKAVGDRVYETGREERAETGELKPE
jgi:hypothetical protein